MPAMLGSATRALRRAGQAGAELGHRDEQRSVASPCDHFDTVQPDFARLRPPIVKIDGENRARVRPSVRIGAGLADASRSLLADGSTGRSRLHATREQRDLFVLSLNLHGLRLARVACRAGLTVAGYDSNGRIISQLKIGEGILNRGFEPTEDIDTLTTAHAVAICPKVSWNSAIGVSECDLAQLIDMSRQVSERLAPGTLVVLEAPPHPGIVRNVILPILELGGLTAGEDFNLAYAPTAPRPEFIPKIGTPKIVGGLTVACINRAIEFYGNFFKSISGVDMRHAEMSPVVQ